MSFDFKEIKDLAELSVLSDKHELIYVENMRGNFEFVSQIQGLTKIGEDARNGVYTQIEFRNGVRLRKPFGEFVFKYVVHDPEGE